MTSHLKSCYTTWPRVYAILRDEMEETGSSEERVVVVAAVAAHDLLQGAWFPQAHGRLSPDRPAGGWRRRRRTKAPGRESSMKATRTVS